MPPSAIISYNSQRITCLSEPSENNSKINLQKGLGLCPDAFVAFHTTTEYLTRLETQMTTAVLALMLFWCNWSCLTMHQIKILLNLFIFSLLIKEIILEILSFKKVVL